jgi:hypothetical protein
MTDIETFAARRRSTTIIMRDGADFYGPRLVTDAAAALCVRAFRFADIAMVTAGGALATAGAYICHGLAPADGAQAAYVGESGNLGKRLQARALDPSKSFATEVYVLAGFERRLDKEAAVHMQMRLRNVSSGGALTVTTYGNVTGTNGNGIKAYNSAAQARSPSPPTAMSSVPVLDKFAMVDPS